MQNQTNKLASLLTYTGFKTFLEGYHTIVKNEFDQYLGINKALICAAKYFKESKQKVFIDELQSIEKEDKTLLTVRKEIFVVSSKEKVDDYQIEVSSELFESRENMEKYIRDEFTSVCVNYDYSIDNILELIEDILDYELYDEDEILSLKEKDSHEMIETIAYNENLYIEDIIKFIYNLSYSSKDLSFESQYIDIKIKPSDL